MSEPEFKFIGWDDRLDGSGFSSMGPGVGPEVPHSHPRYVVAVYEYEWPQNVTVVDEATNVEFVEQDTTQKRLIPSDPTIPSVYRVSKSRFYRSNKIDVCGYCGADNTGVRDGYHCYMCNSS